MWIAWLIRRLPRRESRWILRLPEDTFRPGPCRYRRRSDRTRGPGDVAGVADDGPGDDGAAGGPDRGGQFLPGIAQLDI